MKHYFEAKRLRVCGAPVYLHWSALLVMGGCLVAAVSNPILAGIAVTSYFSVILVHEYGHAWVARRLGYRVLSIRLSVMHGVCEYEGGYTNERDTALIAWGGPAAQFVVAIPVWSVSLVPVLGQSAAFGPLIAFLGYLGPLVALVNLAPSPYLDGSKAWRLVPILWNQFKRRRKKPRARSRLKVVK